MSHVTQVSLRVRDLDALEEAAVACGLELRREQKSFAWWGVFAGDSAPPPGRDPKDFGRCAHALGRPGLRPSNGGAGEWEVGVVPALNGDGFDLLYDYFGSSGRVLSDACGGRELDKLRREYAAAVATKKARQKLGPKGFTVQREDLAGNRIRLRVVHR